MELSSYIVACSEESKMLTATATTTTTTKIETKSGFRAFKTVSLSYICTRTSISKL